MFTPVKGAPAPPFSHSASGGPTAYTVNAAKGTYSISGKAATTVVTSSSVTPAPRAAVQVGAGGALNPRYNPFTKTHELPGMREIIEADDEQVLRVLMEAVVKDKIH